MKKLLTAGIAALALLFAGASPALADEGTQTEEIAFSQEVLDHAANATEFDTTGDGGERISILATFQATSIQPNTRMTYVLTSCRNPGATCTLSKTVTETATISGGGGISFSVLNANLGGSYSSSVTLGVSCTSPVLSWGQVYNAYSMGTFVIFKYNGVNGTAFLPTGFDCRVQAG